MIIGAVLHGAGRVPSARRTLTVIVLVCFAMVGPLLIILVPALTIGSLGEAQVLFAIGLLVCVLLPWRQLIAEPIPALLGFSAVAVLFTGLLWRFLTEADWANNASPRAPRAARVLIFCAYALIAGTARCCSPMAMAVAATSIWTATPRSAAMSSGRRCRWRWWWASSRGQVSTVPNSPARRAASGW